eukprot:3848735-Alexandrium_andersonii.AAC.2
MFCGPSRAVSRRLMKFATMGHCPALDNTSDGRSSSPALSGWHEQRGRVNVGPARATAPAEGPEEG